MAVAQFLDVRPIGTMKKGSTWYLVALAILNVLLAQGTSGATVLWSEAYRELGLRLPEITQFALSLHWWPYLFAGITILLAFVSLSSQWPSSNYFYLMVSLLVLECFILFLTQIIFALPLVGTMATLQ